MGLVQEVIGKAQEVIDKAKEVIDIAVGYIGQAASRLLTTASEKADGLSFEEMSRRLDGALRALRGEEVSTSGAATTPLTTAKPPLQLAQEMVESYTFDKATGVSTFTVPAGVTDVEAMKALNKYFRKYLPQFNRDAVYAAHLDWFENLPKAFPNHCEQRDYSQDRQITITGVVEGTEGESHTTQGSVLKKDSLVFSDPRDQAIAAALHACKHDGRDLFKDLWVRGSVPGIVLLTHQCSGVVVRRSDVLDIDCVSRSVAASGSPSPKLKKP